MTPYSPMSVFLKNNEDDFKNLVVSLCDKLNYPGSPEDVIQDLYLKFLTSKIIESFNPKFQTKDTKITTYLFPIIKNYIISKIKSNECRFFRQNLRNYEPSHDIDEIDMALCHNPIATDYVDVILYNESTDSLEGLGADLKTFRRVSKKKKRYLKKRRPERFGYLEELGKELSKLKKKEIGMADQEYREIARRVKDITLCEDCGCKYRAVSKCPECGHSQDASGCTLNDILILIYKGYSGSQIAKIYGVSDMSVTNAKYELAQELFEFGFRPIKKRAKSNGRIKMSKMQKRCRDRRR